MSVQWRSLASLAANSAKAFAGGIVGSVFVSAGAALRVRFAKIQSFLPMKKKQRGRFT
jgi:hypothetical protein